MIQFAVKTESRMRKAKACNYDSPPPSDASVMSLSDS